LRQRLQWAIRGVSGIADHTKGYDEREANERHRSDYSGYEGPISTYQGIVANVRFDAV
jgi:hypothetical protein